MLQGVSADLVAYGVACTVRPVRGTSGWSFLCGGGFLMRMRPVVACHVAIVDAYLQRLSYLLAPRRVRRDDGDPDSGRTILGRASNPGTLRSHNQMRMPFPMD